MATVSYYLTVNKPAPFNVGLQTITGNINCITISNPGPQAINTPYNGVAAFSYTPAAIANLQFNNAIPSTFVAATTAHGSATLSGKTLTIGLYNFVASNPKPFQVQDIAPPGAPAGTILQSAIASYPVTTTAPTPAAPVPIRPVLPTTVWFCWRGNTTPIHVTDPDVTAGTLNLSTLTFSGQVTIDHVGTPQTLYTSTDGVAWTAAAGSPWTAGSGSVATSIGVVQPAQQQTGVAFTVTGTLGGYTTAPSLQYQDDVGTGFSALPSGSSITATGFSFVQGGLSAATHTITVRDANATGVSATTGPFVVATPVVQSLNVLTPTPQPAGGSFAVSGTIGGYSAAPTLNYRDDSGAYVALPGGAIVTATSFIFTNPGLAAGAHTIGVRDANNVATAVTTGTFNVVAPAIPVITVSVPSLPVATAPFSVTGTLTNYASAPTLTYSDDGALAQAMPSGAVVTTAAYSFIHPGLPAGNHAIVISDGSQIGSTTYTVSPAVAGGASPDGTVVTTPAGSITDTATNRYTITTGAQVAINGLVGTAQFVAGLAGVVNTTWTLTGTTYTYTSVLVNTGTTTIGVFWFAWLPGQSFLPSPTISFIAPPGWSVQAVGPEAGGYSALFTATTPIAPGATASFGFTTPDPPSSVFGFAAAFPTTPVNTCFLYIGAPFGDPGVSVVSANNVPQSLIPATSNVVELAWVGGLVYYQNTSGLWFSETSPAGPWLPPSGTLFSPLAAAPTVVVNAAPTAIAPNAFFAITGALSNYPVAPTLTFSDDGGPATSLPAGAIVTTTGFSFIHPGEPAGTHSLAVSDGARTATITYSVSSPAFISLPSTSSLFNTITGLTAGTSYDIEVYAVNSVGQGPPSAILTVSTSLIVIAVPAAPTGLASAGVTQTAVNLFWTAGIGGSPATSYGTRWSLTGANSWTAGPVTTALNAQITALSSGVTYDFEVWGINAGGAGPFSAILTIATASAVATAVTWQPQGAGAALTFSTDKLTATAGGSAVTGATRQAVVSTASIATGKASFEVTLTGTSNSVSVGLANATFSLGTRLGSDNNSIGIYVGNIPATVTSSSVSGLPRLGMSCMLASPEGPSFSGDPTVANATWAATKQYLCLPRTMGVFPNAQNWDQPTILSNFSKKAQAWGIDADFNGTNAGGIPTIPVLAIPLTTLDSGVTLASLAAGQNTAYFTSILTAWSNAGFKTMMVRLNWADNQTTTPSGQGAVAGSNYTAGSYTPWSFYAAGAGSAANAFCAAYIAAWRVAAHTIRTIATSLGLTVTVGWGPTLTNSCYIDPRRCYPDSVQTDGLGKLVDAHFPGLYFGNWHGNVTSMHTGYQSVTPFASFAVTGQAATTAILAADVGSEYYLADYLGGFIAPSATPTAPLTWSGGWGMFESMVFCLQQGCPMFLGEYGGLSIWDGASYVATGAKQNGTNVTSAGSGAANMTEMAAYMRPRIAWFQSQALNNIANGIFLGWAWWQNQSVETLQAHLTTFSEFGTSPDAGQGTGGTGTTGASRTAPQTIRYNNADVLTPPGNQPAADVAGATVSVCFDADANLVWFTTPAMRADYGATAWNDNATASPGTGIGGIPFNITGSLAACFDTAESGGIAVLNAGSSPYVFSGMPSNFPALQGAPPVVVVPGQVSAVVSVPVSQSITVPATIPNQKSGQAFSLVAAFNYVPNRANLFYSPPNGGFTQTTIAGRAYSNFSVVPPNPPSGGIVWDATGTIATLTFALNTVTSWVFQVIDNTPGAIVTSKAITFTNSATTGGGGTVTATPAASSTVVALSWTAPVTGTGPFTYVVQQSPTGLGTYTTVGSSTTPSVSIPGLTRGIAYDYVIYAANGAGNGTPSAPITYTIPGGVTLAVPDPATGLSVSGATPNSLSLTWQAAVTGAAVTGYQVQYTPYGSSTYLNYSPTTVSQQQVISGLSANTLYNFRVVAFNAVGNAAASAGAGGTTLPIPTVNTTTGPLLTMLTQLTGTGSISGEYIGVGPITPINTIDTVDGQFLGLIGGDYWTPGSIGTAVTSFNAIAKTYWQQGGLVMLSTSIPNPTTGGPSTDLSNLDVSGLLTAGTATNAAFVNSLSQIAAGLADLQAAGVSVIFRPFARANDPSLWWGAGNNTIIH